MSPTTLPDAVARDVPTWSPGSDVAAPADAPGADGRALTLRMEPARRRTAVTVPEATRMAALWHVTSRVAAGDILVVQAADRRRVGRVGETLFRYFRTEGGRSVVFDFEVENAEAIAALGLDVRCRPADAGPAGDAVDLVPVDYDLPLLIDDRTVYPGDAVHLAPGAPTDRHARRIP